MDRGALVFVGVDGEEAALGEQSCALLGGGEVGALKGGACHARYTVVFGEAFVEEAKARREQGVKFGVPFPDHVVDKAFGFCAHIVGDLDVEGGVFFVAFAHIVELIELQPLVEKVADGSARFGVLKHTAGLGGDLLGGAEFAFGGRVIQGLIRCRGPQEVREASGDLVIVEFDGLCVGCLFAAFDAIEKVR